MSLYDILGVNPDAEGGVIRAAFRNLAKRHHPDKGGKPEDFAKVQHAYLVLRDPKTRDRYDRTGEDELAPDNELAEISNMIVNAFDQATGECGGNFDTVDLISAMRNHLSARLQNAQSGLAQLKAGEEVIAKIIKRLSYKGEKSDLIGAMLNNRVRDSQNAQAAVAAEIETIERAQEYAKDYGYAFEAPAPPPPQSEWMQRYQSAAEDRQRLGGGLGGFFR